MSPAHRSAPARWPYRAEGQRRDIRSAADDIRELIGEALEASDDNNRHLVRALLAMIGTRAADIQRLTVEARIGPEPGGNDETA